jgi:hypothetical protein
MALQFFERTNPMARKLRVEKQREDLDAVPWAAIVAMAGLALAAAFSCIHYLMRMR